MPNVNQDKIKEIVVFWEKKLELTPELRAYWMSLTTAERREIQNDYDYEIQDD